MFENTEVKAVGKQVTAGLAIKAEVWFRC